MPKQEIQSFQITVENILPHLTDLATKSSLHKKYLEEALTKAGVEVVEEVTSLLSEIQDGWMAVNKFLDYSYKNQLDIENSKCESMRLMVISQKFFHQFVLYN